MGRLFEQLQKAADFKAQAHLASAIAADEVISAAARAAAETESERPPPLPETSATPAPSPASEPFPASAAIKALGLAIALALASVAWYYAPSRDATPDRAQSKQPPASKLDRELSPK